MFLRVVFAFFILLCGFNAYAESVPLMDEFRDAVYGQTISVADAMELHQRVSRQAQENLTGYTLYAALSRCEYFLGRVYQDNDQNTAATTRFENGINLAEQSLKVKPNAEAFEMLASNYGQLCMIKSNAWVMANGLKVEDNAKKALQHDNHNAGAMYLIASRWAFGPGMFGNPKRGITELQAILDSQANLGKDDYFNVYSALAYAHFRLNQNREAFSYISRALSLYPTNKFALDLNYQITQKLGTTR